MSWATVEKTQRYFSGRYPATGIAVGLHKDSKQPRATLAIRLGKNVIDTLGLKAPMRVKVQLGEGDNAGMMRLSADADGFTVSLLNKHSKAGVVALKTYPAAWLSTPHPSEECRYDVIDGAVIVKLPAWLVAPNGAERRVPVFQSISDQPVG